MAKPVSRQGLVNALVLALLLGVLVTQAVQVGATHSPADKAIASGSTIQEVSPAATTPGIGTDANNILTTRLKTSSPSDLMLQVTLECSILTDVVAEGSGTPGSTSSGSAQGTIRVWVVIDDSYIVPINNVSGTPQPGNHSVGDDDDKVTFCNRHHKVDITDAEVAADGTDTQRHFIRTKAANAFNWVALNLGNGQHTIDVRADFTSGPGNTTGSTSSGFVGNRLVLVEPTKMANDVVI
jgi:hypothetical protein